MSDHIPTEEPWHEMDRAKDDEIARLRERVLVLEEAAQWVIDARYVAGNDAHAALITAADLCRDAIAAAKEAGR